VHVVFVEAGMTFVALWVCKKWMQQFWVGLSRIVGKLIA
jgi:hypothetical protein